MSCIKCARDTSFAFFLIFFVIFIVVFSTPFWYEYETGQRSVLYGLWLKCTDGIGHCESIGGNVDSAFKATRALMCIALIFYGISFVSYCVWISKGRQYLKKHGAGSAGIVALSVGLTGAIFNIIGTIVFGANYADDIGDFDMEDMNLQGSFICAAVIGVLQLVNLLITLPVVTCCFKPEDISNEVQMATPPSTTITVITEDKNPPDSTILTTSGTNQNITAPTGFVATGYLPPGDYPPQASYPLAGSYPPPAGGYPPPGSYPPPMGYPPAGAYPNPAGYPVVGGNPYPMSVPNKYEPPPAYDKPKEESAL